MNRFDLVLAPVLGVVSGLACGRGKGLADAATEVQDEPHSRAATGVEVVVTLLPGEEQAMGLEFAPLAALSVTREAETYGRVLSDPARSTTLRAPLAGTLALADAGWPALGARVASRAVLVHLVPRWTPQDRLDLEPRAVAARAELAGLDAELPALEAELERARTLNADEKTVSDRELAAAEARLALQRARLAGARELSSSLETLLTSSAEPAPIDLVAAQDGEVVELFAHPGEFVESGAALLRIEDFRSLLCSIDLPLDYDVQAGAPAGVAEARVRPFGTERLLTAERVGVAPGGNGLLRALLFRLQASEDLALRPGLGLTAWLPLESESRTGVLVPRSALVRLAGRGFVYLRNGENALVRREIELSSPVEGGWFATTDWLRGVEVLVRGAQNVLSFELLGRQGQEEEEE